MTENNTSYNREKWDFFIAHAGPDTKIAEELYDLLTPCARVFVDSRSLALGDTWDTSLASAQQSSLITVVLVSSNTERAYYQREEVAAAIDMARKNPHTHRVVPLYIETDAEDARIPYGLRLKHGITLTDQVDLPEAARRLLNLLQSLSDTQQSGNVPRTDKAGGTDQPPTRKFMSVVWRSWQKLRKSRRLFAASVLIAVLVALLWLSKSPPTLLRRLYPETADVRISIEPLSISVGQSMQVQVTIAQTSVARVGEGVVKLHIDPRLLSFAPHSPQSLNTEAVAGVVTLQKPFVLFAIGDKPGKAEIYATLETRFGKHTSSVSTIDVSSGDSVVRPYIEQGGSQALNLSGEWHIELGGLPGTMVIKQDAKNLVAGTGRLYGNPESNAEIDGFKDGTSFKVFFDRQGDSRRWRVDANFELNPKDMRFIEMKGCAFLIQRDETIKEDSVVSPKSDPLSCEPRSYVGWRGINAATFWASAQLGQ